MQTAEEQQQQQQSISVSQVESDKNAHAAEPTPPSSPTAATTAKELIIDSETSTPVKAEATEHVAVEAMEDAASEFGVRIIAEQLTSVSIEWNAISHADVYEIEKFHRRRGWEQVAWIATPPATVENLAENFTYRLRIKALRYAADARAYVVCKCSPEFMVTTQPPLPTTLCLHRAIKKGQQFLVKRILRRRPSLLDSPGPNGYLPLANAITSGEHCVIDVLLSHGANVHIGNPFSGRTPLHLAFYHGRLAVARILLNRRANLEGADLNGMTPSHFAVDANQYEVLKFALESGANVEALDDCGWTLLSRAVVMETDVAIIKLLLQHGANMKTLDKLGKTCVDLACIYHNAAAAAHFEKILKKKQ